VTQALRRIDDARGTVLVVGAALLVTIISIVAAMNQHLDQRGIAVAFGVFIALGEVVRISLPGDGEAAPIAAAAALAYALLGEWGGTPTTHTVADVVMVTALAGLVGAVPHVVAGRQIGLDVLARRVLAVAFAAVLFRPLYDGGQGILGRLEQTHLSHGKAALAMVMVVIALLAGLFEAAVAALVRADRDRAPYVSSLRSELRSLVSLGSAIGATGVLIALAAGVMQLWAIPVFVVPLLLTQFSVRRYAGITQTYAQTIRSLSRVTEVGGYTETGHSRRVSELSLAVGRELGMTDSELVDLEYAALMHDLGQLSLTEPIPGGATVMAGVAEQRYIAEMGAQVIRQTGVLERVADIVERQADPYRRPHETVDGTLPLASRIIKAANAYDDLVGDSRESVRRLEALERLRLSMAYDYDPRVVSSLARVVERQQRMGL
jgi:HD domain